jgi:hypothetical protein
MFGLKPAKAVSPADLEEMLGWDGCYGLDETPFSCIVDEDPDMMALFEKTLAAGKVVTGHVSDASEAEVQAFVAMGGTVDHEAVNVEETFARARSGMKVLMRFGSGVPDLPNLIGAYTERGMDPRQLSVCTPQSSTVQSCFETLLSDSLAGSTRATCLNGQSNYRWSEPRPLQTFEGEKFRNSSSPSSAGMRKLRTFAEDSPNRSNRPEGDLQGRPLRTGGKRKKAVFG